MILGKELESGRLDKIDDLQRKLSIKKSHIDCLKEWMSQMQFCITIHPQLKVTTKLGEILLVHIKGVENELELSLSKLMSKEEMEEMKMQHRQNIHEQEKEFNI
jgi:hypothetical protein